MESACIFVENFLSCLPTLLFNRNKVIMPLLKLELGLSHLRCTALYLVSATLIRRRRPTRAVTGIYFAIRMPGNVSNADFICDDQPCDKRYTKKKKELIHSVVGSHSFSFGVNRLACSTFDPRIKQEAGK
jgi:hypothetical protein